MRPEPSMSLLALLLVVGVASLAIGWIVGV
jgi:hypothetical protein